VAFQSFQIQRFFVVALSADFLYVPIAVAKKFWLLYSDKFINLFDDELKI
jgi:hypothetical protein